MVCNKCRGDLTNDTIRVSLYDGGGTYLYDICYCPECLKEMMDNEGYALVKKDSFNCKSEDLALGAAKFADEWYRKNGIYNDDTFDDWYHTQVAAMPTSAIVEAIKKARNDNN